MKRFEETDRETVVVQFLASERKYIDELALQRHTSNRRHGIQNRRLDPNQTDRDLDYRSMLSEYAVAKYLRLMPNKQTVFDDTCRLGDLRLPGGDYLEVKCPRKRGSRFFIPSTKNVTDFVAAVGVLVWPTDDEDILEIMGYTTGPRFHRQAHIFTPNTSWGVPFAVLDNKHLLPIPFLRKKVRKKQNQ